jgi:DNA-binding transcriptional regulator/RsmH inhibitor MraZ
VQIDHYYGGSALAAVDGRGRVRLPGFVREVAARRTDAQIVVVGAHESDPCLIGYDPTYRRALFEDWERSRLRDESGSSAAHHGRGRRAFGLTEQAAIDRAGRIALPPMMLRLGRIEDSALFVGTGGAFEIWNPRLAAESDDFALAELARWRLGHDQPQPNQMED